MSQYLVYRSRAQYPQLRTRGLVEAADAAMRLAMSGRWLVHVTHTDTPNYALELSRVEDSDTKVRIHCYVARNRRGQQQEIFRRSAPDMPQWMGQMLDHWDTQKEVDDA